MIFRAVYFLYLLIFFAKAQSDVVAYLAAMIFGHPVAAWPWMTALLLAAVLTAMACGLEKILARRNCNAFPAYVASSWVAVTLVSMPFAGHVRHSVLLLVAVMLGVGDWWWKKQKIHTESDQRTLWQSFMPSVMELIALFLYTGVGAAAADTDHYELRTAQAIASGRSMQAYHVGERALSVTPRLFAMRCYLMATTQEKGLGEKFMEQPVPDGDSRILLFPTDARQQCLLPCDSLNRLLGGTKRADETPLAYFRRCAYAENDVAKKNKHKIPRPAADYYLSALLLERRLDEFAREVKILYPAAVSNGTLPAYFAQALVFYVRQRSNPVVRYHDTAIEANLRDYSDMADTIPDRRKRCNLLRRSYGETYWWWYEYAR